MGAIVGAYRGSMSVGPSQTGGFLTPIREGGGTGDFSSGMLSDGGRERPSCQTRQGCDLREGALKSCVGQPAPTRDTPCTSPGPLLSVAPLKLPCHPPILTCHPYGSYN